jgi:polyisoprenoid-binding protein YceI
MHRKVLVLILSLVTVATVAGFSGASSSDVALPVSVAPAEVDGRAGQQTRRLKLTVSAQNSEARYRVREQLVGFELPNDAVGKTKSISGALVIESNGRIVKEESKFSVDLRTLVSDQERRDGFIKNNTLETAEYPMAEFIPGAATGLPSTLPAVADLSFRLSGDLTLHGVTKPATWDVRGKMLASGEFTGTATTAFKFADFNLTVPRVRLVLSVVDSITLEMDLHMLPGM